MALSTSVQECLWIVSLCKEIGISLKEPIKIMHDNQGSVSLAKNPGQHSQTKHIDIRHHFIREKRKSGLILCYRENGSRFTH
jgi:hypothetical protein